MAGRVAPLLALSLWAIFAFIVVSTEAHGLSAQVEPRQLAPQDSVKGAPEFDPDGDEIPNRADPDDDNDGVPDSDDPALYDSYDPKPWLDPDFLAPSDPQQREALWGPVVDSWVEPNDGNCKEHEYGAEICDFPNGTVTVRIVKDWSEWAQYPDGAKEWFARPQDRPAPATEIDPATATKPRPDDACARIGDWGPAHPGGAQETQPDAINYQVQITGVPPIWGFYVLGNPTEFDGCRNGVLLEAKGPSLSRIYRFSSKAKAKAVQQGGDQQGAAMSVVPPPPLEWHVAEADAADTLRGWFGEAGISYPTVMHTPYVSPAP